METKNQHIIRILKGILISFLVTLVGIFLFAILLTYSNVSENIIPIVLIVLTFISIFIGSVISVRKINKNGLLNGAMIGGIYVILLYLISSILNTGFAMNVYTILMIVIGMIAGMIGGIIGVNT